MNTKYTQKELKDLPLTKEEADGHAALVKGQLINNVKFWIIVGVLIVAVNFLLQIPEYVDVFVKSFFKL